MRLCELAGLDEAVGNCRRVLSSLCGKRCASDARMFGAPFAARTLPAPLYEQIGGMPMLVGAAIGAAVAILIGWFFFWRGKPTKTLDWQIIANSPLLAVPLSSSPPG